MRVSRPFLPFPSLPFRSHATRRSAPPPPNKKVHQRREHGPRSWRPSSTHPSPTPLLSYRPLSAPYENYLGGSREFATLGWGIHSVVRPGARGGTATSGPKSTVSAGGITALAACARRPRLGLGERRQVLASPRGTAALTNTTVTRNTRKIVPAAREGKSDGGSARGQNGK